MVQTRELEFVKTDYEDEKDDGQQREKLSPLLKAFEEGERVPGDQFTS